MSDSSERNDSPFAGVRFKSLLALIRLVRESAISDVQYIRRRFAEVASGFDATLDFLSALGCIVSHEGSLTLRGTVATLSHTDAQLSSALLELLGDRSGPIRAELFDFLEKFQVVNGSVLYRPLADHRSVESDVRNLLLELALITHDAELGAYLLGPKHCRLLMKAARGRRTISPEAIEEHRKGATAVGEAMERAIIRHEQLRLGEQYAQYVEHVALTDAAAGYDVQSITVESHQTLIPRLIEVKAVPSNTLRFFWTANEVSTARRFGSWYFLYLIPVRGDGQPDLNGLRVINDPYGVIMEANTSWDVVPELFKCESVVAASHRSDLLMEEKSDA